MKKTILHTLLTVLRVCLLACIACGVVFPTSVKAARRVPSLFALTNFLLECSETTSMEAAKLIKPLGFLCPCDRPDTADNRIYEEMASQAQDTIEATIVEPSIAWVWYSGYARIPGRPWQDKPREMLVVGISDGGTLHLVQGVGYICFARLLTKEEADAVEQNLGKRYLKGRKAVERTRAVDAALRAHDFWPEGKERLAMMMRAPG